MSQSPIRHVFVLMLENRSFDHMLGFSGITGVDVVTGEETSINGLTGDEFNNFNNKTYKVTSPAPLSMTVDPGHEFENVLVQLVGPGTPPKLPPDGSYPPIHNTGYVASFVGSMTEDNKADPGVIMRCLAPEEVPVLVSLAKEFAICDSWFSSMPGPTWPNRFFAVAGSSGGLDHSPSNEETLIWETLDGFKTQNGTLFDRPDLSWRIYCGGVLCIAQTLKNISFRDVRHFSKFIGDVSSTANPYKTQFTFIEPDYGDIVSGTFKNGTSQHPLDSVTGGEKLIKEVYETIRNSPIWESSMLIVTWDEHGGFFDHVKPPKAIPPGDKIEMKHASQFGFNFAQYGIRVPAVVVSPFIPKNLVDHRLYDHTSMLATVESLFDIQPLTERDKHARNLLSLASLKTPRDTPRKLPQPVTQNAVTDTIVPDRSGPISGANLPGFFSIALRSHLHSALDHERESIMDRVKTIKTRGEASDFIREAEEKIRAFRSAMKSD